MDPDPAATETHSPPPSPSPPASSLLEPQDDERERGAVELAVDPASPPPPPSPMPNAQPPEPEETDGEDAAASSEVVQEKEAVADVTSLRSPPPHPGPAIPQPGEIPAIASSLPPPTPVQIAAMDPDPAAAETHSPPPSPSPQASPPLEPQGDELERGAVVSAADPASPPQPQPQQIDGEDAAGSSAVVQEKAAVSDVGEALRRFKEEFGEECLVQSPELKNIVTPDRPAALHFLGEKYNNLLEKYKKQLSKCSDECVPKYECLKKKYTDEYTERRRLNNELIELKGNIRVFCRCRPLSADEVTRGCSSVVDIDPLCETELQFLPTEKERKTFRFDRVFGPEDSQEAVFAETVPVVRSVMDGFNVCIFAYGQTGTGKTFTMEGLPEKRGVNYRSLEELFRMSEERSASVAYTFSVSILEVYNEQIKDLLDDSSKKLEIKQSSDGTQDVPGLVDAPIYSIEGVWEKLKAGARNRSVGSTNANELSSRSHSFVRVTVRSEHLVTGQQSKSYIWLVDLAGSERCDKTGADGERLKESQYINKSLSALGDVMSALASKKNCHIPYRNSKLTHLLQSSLGGDCKTLMFVQISPSSSDSGETLSSLTYASRVRSIEHGPARKQADPVERLKLKQMTEKLKQAEKENEELKRNLQLMNLKYASRDSMIRSLNDKVRDAERTCRVYLERNKELENEIANGKKTARDPARLSRPPLVPMWQRQPPQGRNSNYMPPGPSRSRFSKAPTIQNKENIPVIGTTAHPGTDKEKAVGKARRVSLTPVMRQIPLQPKRRASMAILPSLSEQLSSVHAGKRASRSSIAFPGAPLGAIGHVPSYMTPDGREEKVSKFDFGSSSKFSSPARDRLKRNNIPSTPLQRLGLPPGPGNASKRCFSVQKRVVVSPLRAKFGAPSGAGTYNPAPLDKTLVMARAGNALRVLNPKRRQSVI